MASLFDDYAVIAESGLFDAEYYLATNPDVAELDCDPLLHYVEYGASQMRNPNREFDAKSYFGQCRARGETPSNPLLHYIGARNGTGKQAVADQGKPNQPAQAALLLALDSAFVHAIGDGSTVRVRGNGWAIAPQPITGLQVTIGGFTVSAQHGSPRSDVAKTYPQYPMSEQSGFSFTLDGLQPAAAKGPVDIAFAVTTGDGQTHRVSTRTNLTPSAEPAPVPAEAPQTYDGPQPMKLEVDTSAVDSAGILTVTGWCVCLAPIASVQVFIDDQPIGRADYGQPRPDVALIYPDYPDGERSGFELKTDTASFGTGQKMLKVLATASTGIVRETIIPLDLIAHKKRPSQAKDQSVKIFCDATELTTDGWMVIEGWAICPADTDYIKVELNGTLVGEAEIGRERPDVGNLFPILPHARRAGFSFRKMTPKAVPEGEHIVVLRISGGGVESDIPLPLLAQPAPERGVAGLPAAAPSGEQLKLNIDLPLLVGGVMDSPVRGNLEIAGWAVARGGVEAIDILLDGEFLASAYTGVRRLDVHAQFSDWPEALTSGFTALLPHRALPIGNHRLSVVLKDKTGNSARNEFTIEVEKAPETTGPWTLSKKTSIAGDEINRRILDRIGWGPTFRILLAIPAKDKEALRLARLTLVSIAAQTYRDYRILILPQGKGAKPNALAQQVLNGLPALEGRVEFIEKPNLPAVGSAAPLAADASYFITLKAGDLLGCDALMEFALDSGFHRQADFIYADDRRISPVSGTVEAFFKPDWSPDLLLSTDYIGRAWCAKAALIGRAGLTLGDCVKYSTYDLALQLTEAAQSIRHLPRVLLEGAIADSGAGADKRALASALKRRGIDGTVEDGAAPGIFRVKRNVTAKGMVSIIIPTCATRGLIKVCLDTLRAQTRYPNFEIVCIENIPADQQEWKDWLRANADTVIGTTEPFNWSRFNNLAVDQSRGEYLLFLNDDIEILTPDWLDALLEHAQRPEVGVVGPQLLYPDRRVQHAGMFLAATGIARHAFRYMGENDLGYFGLALTQRDVIAVTGACLLTRRQTFEDIGRFDETHTVTNNDLDYCLRIWRAGLSTVYTPHTTLIHHEQVSRIEMGDIYNASAFNSAWGDLFTAGDPFFHTSLSKERDDFSFEWEPVELLCAGRPVYDRTTIKQILIVKLDHIGDCITAMPAIRRLKRHFPDARFSVLSSRASKPMWSLEPTIDEVIEFDFFHAKSSLGEIERTDDDWRQLEETLAPYGFDLAVDLRKHMETRPVLRRTGARYTAGYDHKGKYQWLDIALEWNEDQASFRKRQHTGDDLNNLIDAIAAAGEDERATVTPVRGSLPKGLADDALFAKPVVCIHPSAGNDMKQWPADYFTSLINQLIALDDVHVAIVGAPDDAEIAAGILAGVVRPDAVWSFVGKLKLAELPAFIALCSLFVGNDSGPKHIAAGLGIPTLGVHSGTVDSREWGPMGALAVGIDRDMTCSPCYRSKLEDCHRALACLRHILPGDVYRACKKLLALSALQPEHGEILSACDVVAT
jgi:ADP-heptose:LPS heptosyltransferase/GT2 family glycosyltransferase